MHGQCRDIILQEFTFSLSAGRAGIVGDDDANALYTGIVLEIFQCPRGSRVQREISSTICTAGYIIGGELIAKNASLHERPPVWSE